MANEKFSDLLLNWFDLYGRHDLPWQKNPTPYRVWVSEIMLQQTQVQTVIPFFTNFVRLFPSIKVLSEKNLDEVLNSWSGLGYYSRARNLHKAARMIVEQYGGVMPTTTEELMGLPGIGKSTAGAIIALALNQPAAILDANVKRVLSRYHAIKAKPETARTKKQLWANAEMHLPTSRHREYTQALMDLGAMVCKKEPICSKCPYTNSCAAYLSNSTRIFPGSGKRKPPKTKSTYIAIIRNRKREILLERRPESGIWGGLWSFPEFDKKNGAETIILNVLDSANYYCEQLPPKHHHFTHFKLILKPLLFTLIGDNSRLLENDGRMFFQKKSAKTIGTPKPVVDLLNDLWRKNKENS